MKLANEDFVLANVSALPAWLEEFDAFGAVALELEKWHRKLHAQAPSIMKRIGRAFREQDGYATVRHRGAVGVPAGAPDSMNGPPDHDEVRLARLAGEPMTNPHYRPSAAHAKLRHRLVALLGDREGKISEAALSDVLMELAASEEKLAASAKEIRAWSRDATKFFNGLVEARQFFSRENLAALQGWGGHAENPEPFVVDHVHNSVTFKGMGGDHATVAVPRERIPEAVTFGAVKDG